MHRAPVDSELVRLYGHAHSQQIEEQLRRAEQWEQGHKEDPDLLMTLARLHLANRDRDKARDHLLKAVRLGGSREEYLEPGLLLESMGESDKALQCYRRGLQSAESKDAPQLLTESATAEGELIPLPSTEQRLKNPDALRSLRGLSALLCVRRELERIKVTAAQD